MAAQAGPPPGLDTTRALTQYVFDRWSDREGLPHPTVTSIAQTPDGYLWLGTFGGLARFDGVRFTVFDPTNTPAMKSGSITALSVDRTGALWVGTSGSGLLRYADGAFTSIGTAQGLSHGFVRSLLADREANLWIGTLGGGLNRLREGRITVFGPREGIAHAEVAAVVEDRAGDLWIGTRGGLNRMHEGRLVTLGRRDGLPHEYVSAIAEGPDGTLWFGTAAGLARYAGGRFTPVAIGVGIEERQLNDVLVDAGGTVWAGSNGGGLLRLRGDRLDRYSVAEGLASGLVRSLFQDREGSLWLGLSYGGLARIRDGKFAAIGRAEGLSADITSAVLEHPRGVIWIGTVGAGLNRLEGGRVTHYGVGQGLLTDIVIALAPGRGGRVWVATSRGGVASVGPEGVRRIRNPNTRATTIQDIIENRRGELWVATAGAGLQRWLPLPSRALTRADGLADDIVQVVVEGADGDLWLGTRGGLSRVHDGRVTTWTDRDGLPDPYVRSLFADSDGTMWVGTQSGGLARWRAGRIESFGFRGWLPSPSVNSVMDDGAGDLWLGTNRGIARVHKSDLDARAAGQSSPIPATVYGTADGLRSAQITGGNQPPSLRAADGTLWFPGPRGVGVIDPRRIRSNRLAPQVLIERVEADRRVFEPRDDIVLPAGTQRVEIVYTATSLVAPEGVRFRYRLEGFDTAWVDAGAQRQASFTGPAPRRYLFRVTAANEDGVWNETGASLRLRVRPFVYQRLSVQVVVALLVGGAFLAGHRRRVRLRRRRHDELVNLVAERTRAEERYRGLFENALDAIFTVDVAGTLTSCNAAAEAVTGYAREEVLGMALTQLLPPGAVSAIPQASSARGEMEIVSKEGVHVPLEYSARAIVEDGRPAGVQVIARDVRQRQVLEATLRQAPKMEAVGRLAGGVAHDFNNILTAMRTNAEFILDAAPLGDPIREDAEEIRDAVDRAAALTRQLLAFSRKQVVNPRVLDPNEVIRDLDKLLRRVIGEDIALELRLDPGIATVLIDPTLLEQALVNLVVNARDAMPQGGHLTLSSANATIDETATQQHVQAPPGAYVLIAVGDTGTGMTEATKGHLFEPFFTTKEPGRGTGLGLATVFGAVTQAGGHVAVYSELGHGTTVKLYLPRADAAAEPRADGVRPAERGGSETVLVVEDETALRRAACRLLEGAGYTVLEAADGQAALTVAGGHAGPIDVLLSDVVMPGMSGRELAECLTTLRPEMRVVFVSGYTDDAVLRHGVEAATMAFVQKPFTRRDLLEKVREVLDGPATQPPAPREA